MDILQDIHLLEDLLYKHLLFHFFENFQTAYKTLISANEIPLNFNRNVVIFTGLLLFINLSFLIYYVFFRRLIQTKTGNFLLLFFDIPNSEVELIHRKAVKFLSFCKVSLQELFG